jgi:hypothetical protein
MFNQLIEKSKKSTLLLIKNGFYIPLIGYFLFCCTNNLFLTSIILMKLFPANFFFWFCHNMKYFQEPYQSYNQIKQFIRFTDTGHIASFIYYFYPEFLPIAFNIHSIICIGYWYGRFVLKMADADTVSDPEYILWFNDAWTAMNHGMANVLLIRELYINNYEICYNYFTSNDLFYSYLWVYCWFFFIYLPWRYLTNDCVYEIFGDKYMFSTKVKFIGLIHIIILVSNNIGYLLSCTASN